MTHSIACIQMTSGMDINQNLAIAEELIKQAAASGAKVAVLPEMFARMSTEADKLKYKEQYGHGLIQDFLRAQAKKYGIWIIGGTIPLAASDIANKVCAACLVFDEEGELVARYDKAHLFDVYVRSSQETFAESRTMVGGNEVVVIPTPIGRVGLAVCYDLRFPELFRQMHAQAVEVIVLPAAFTYATGMSHWDILVKARAVENLAYMVACGQAGHHANGRQTYGHSMIVDPWGKIKAQLPEGQGVISAEINLGYLQQVRRDFPVLSHRKW